VLTFVQRREWSLDVVSTKAIFRVTIWGDLNIIEDLDFPNLKCVLGRSIF
jgi:hypothetical protein